MNTVNGTIALTPLDGPTVLIEMGSTRFLVDPTFDSPREYPIGSRVLTKTTDAPWTPQQVGPVDAVLLSHDQHPDNLDHGGREYVATAPLTLTNEEAVQAVEILGRPRVLPVHTDGWAHFTQNGASLRAAFDAAGLGQLLVVAAPGQAAPFQ